MEIKEYIKDNVLIFDGAMGTMLQKNGLQMGENPEIFGFNNPDILINIHKAYLEAGSNVVTTNTFGANELKLDKLGYTVEEIVDNAIYVAKKAIEKVDKSRPRYVALDIGPIGEMLEPMGTLSFDRAYEIFKRQAVQGEKSGANLIIIETMMDLYEAKAAVLAVKENTDLPIFCTMTFNEDGRSFTGCTPESMVATLGGLGVDAIGVNCSLGPKQLLPIVKNITKRATVPVIVQANAGLPNIVDGQAYYDVDEKEFYSGVVEFINAGARIIGGCCGTNPNFIKYISDNIKDIELHKIESYYKCVVCSPSKFIEIDKPIVMGERLNPTGRKSLKEALKNENIDYIIKLALEQINAGAEILNVNVGLPDIDEKIEMPKIIKEIQGIIDTPLQIDSSNIEALEQGLRYYNGRTIVNSVNGKEDSLEKILPIVKKYGSALVGLALDDNGIPETAEGRFEIAKKIVKRAQSYGIRKEDIFIDCLSLTVSAQQSEAMETIKAIKLVKEKLGVKTILGVSNISFGIPSRKHINNTYLNLALGAGLDLAIINPNEEGMVEAIDAFRVINNIDKGCNKYIDKYGKVSKDLIKSKSNNIESTLEEIVVRGLKEEARDKTIELLKESDANIILDEILIPSLDNVGKKYDSGEIFLPQLIQCAETVKASLNVIKEKLLQESTNNISKGKIIVATVKGDIHDIGKNIVKIMLENYGYEVIDLGKDVPIEKVVQKSKELDIKLVGLSALMTTTVKSMEDTIKALRDNNIDAKVFVGGAVLTEEYAKNIGADYYSKDAKSAIEIAQMRFKI
ncbi:homocysteine methyltransferase [Romboutsia ilealis]|uniref:Methionine synthase n=1 Tax=Romboutsia faecis TaxID=2764597 RepID=A0ABR7JTJ5_9FIRM|nr:homocysteine S-methyltransferase family protein [Romboutsia faecis]MBC5998224.1 homocysteine S-methyltransferase family protein [Romboutsia faecis]MRN25844.1 homocysteine methyltransferase [Romboutsia ilealis]